MAVRFEGRPPPRRAEAIPVRKWPEAIRWRHGREAKFTTGQILEMRRRHAAGERLVDIASDFGIGGGHVHRIVNRGSYRWVA